MPRKKVSADPPVAGKAPVRQAAGSVLPAGYADLLADLKVRIRSAQVKAAVAVNRELIGLYWQIGRGIVERQEREGWGKSVVDRLAADLQAEFPGQGGYSPRNIWLMRAFYLAWTQGVAILQQPAAELPPPVRELDGRTLPAVCASLPWFHNVVLVEKLKDPAQRLWYAAKAVEAGWSRAVLVHQIEADLFARQGKAISNFDRTLPAPQSDLAGQLLKDPHNFEFLALADDARERHLEAGLLGHLKTFLLELGVGFAFVGSQYHLEVGDQDFYLDLLFYHLKLRCFVVIDLKVEPFQPEFAGKMNFYLSAADDLLRHPDDRPSIGLILCKEKNRVIVEYSLRDTTKPMAVGSYTTRRADLPAALRASLPTVEQLEEEMQRAEAETAGGKDGE